MKFTKNLPFLLVALVLTIAGAMSMTGCGDQPLSPVIQDNGGDAGGGKFGDDPADQASLIATTLKIVENTVEVVGAAGGEICESLSNGRQTGLVVPEGALDDAVAISMTVEDVSSNTKTSATYTFGPAGLHFNEATTLFLDCNDADGTVKTLKWYDPAKHKWVVQARTTVQNGRVQFSIWHFSKYGIS